ncbi:MAG: leucine-rich repeat protein [Clostridia bacterium]|nr:leucine-rich repeat protein [Clostridia bacterium]
MTKKLKTISIIIATVLSALSFFFCEAVLPNASATEKEITASGTTGEVYWTFYSDGELYIYGDGATADYESYTDQPWTSYKHKINKITVGEGVTAVGEHAFSVTAVKNARIASTVKEIGSAVFSGCSYLEEIELEYGLHTIGSSAFSQCKNLKSIDLPDSVTDMGMYCFNKCQSLESIVIPPKLYRIREHLFWECSSLKEITFGTYTSYLSASAFYGCKSLENVYYGGTLKDWCKIFFGAESGNPLAYADNLYLNGEKLSSDLVLPDNLTAVLSNAFYGASFIESVTFPETIDRIGQCSFANCANLKKVVLNEGLQSIGYYAFEKCSSLTEITIPKTVTEIKGEVFKNCQALTRINVDPQNTEYSNDEHGALFNKEQTILIQYPLGSSEKAYHVPETVEIIKNYSFTSSSTLEEIYVPEATTSIEYFAFSLSSISDVYYDGSKAEWSAVINDGDYSKITVHYSLKDTDKSVIIIYTDDDFDGTATDIHLEATELDSVTSKYEKNGFYTKLMVSPIRILDIRLSDGNGNAVQPIPGNNITVKIKAPDAFLELLEKGLECSGEYGVEAKNIDFINDCFIFTDNGDKISVPADENFLKSFSIIHWHSDATDFNDFDPFTHDKISVINGYIIIETDHFSEYAVCAKAISFLQKDIVLEIDDSSAPAFVNFENAEIIYFSSDESIAVVDENGVITAVSPGTATITATVKSTDISDTCTVTVKPRKFTVKWFVDGVATEQTVTEEAAITKPANPEKEGYTFIGWTPEVPDTMPAENLEFTAVWQINKYTITFDTAGGTAIAPITLEYGAAITAPANPEKEGYTFIGWTPEVPDTMPAENLEFTAVWQVNKYTITFDTAGGTAIAPITLEYGTTITSPANPEKEGFDFIRWAPELPDTMPANDITVVAEYKKAEKPEAPAPTITGIKIIALPNKTKYIYKDESFELNGLALKVMYSDGTSKIITDTNAFAAYGFNADSVGTKTITVAYGSYTDEFEITVSYAWWQWIIRILLLGFLWY